MSTDKQPLPEAVREQIPVPPYPDPSQVQHATTWRAGWSYGYRAGVEAAAQQARARLAHYITEYYFTSGNGERADRLVLMVDGPPKRELGGWGKLPFYDRLLDLLVTHPPPTPEAKP